MINVCKYSFVVTPLSLMIMMHVSALSNACDSPLGMQDGRIKNSQLLSFSYVEGYEISRLGVRYDALPKYGRLNGNRAWCGRGLRRFRGLEYFQIDCGETVNVSGLATQGLHDWEPEYVKTYKLRFSLNGSDWFNYSSPNKVWTGNKDGREIVKNDFGKSIQARFLRIYPEKDSYKPCLRVEVFGCRLSDLEKTITNTASSSHQIPTLQPSTRITARLPTSAIPDSQRYNTAKFLPTLVPSSISTKSQITYEGVEKSKIHDSSFMESNAVLALGMCVAFSMLVVVTVLVFLLLRSKSVGRMEIAQRNWEEMECHLMGKTLERFGKREFV